MVSISQFLIAQKTAITGLIKNEKGMPIPFVLVKDQENNSAVFSDSLGNFTINITPGSSLFVSSKGYKDEILKIGEQNNFQVVLKYADIEKTKTNNSNIDYTSRDAFSGQTNTVSTYNTSSAVEGGEIKFNGASFPIAREKEETHGNRYYNKDWSNGYVINTQGKQINNAGLLFNYDKVSGDLLLTHDQKTAIIVNRNQIKSFTLYDVNKKEHRFEIIPAIDAVRFVEVLTDGSKYKIYKLTKTKFIPSNYTTNGLVSSGNSYDEYADENAYYLLTANDQMQKLALKRKAIKHAFENDENKLDAFFSKNNSGNIDDQFLKDLGDYMNQ